MSISILKTLTAKSLVLVAINIFQPCKKAILEENLKTEADSKLLDDVITELLEEKRVTCERDYFRLTLKGMNSIMPGKGRILRDLQRMEYLSQSVKKRGGYSLDDDSSPFIQEFSQNIYCLHVTSR